ncbi:hypothetical protein CYJ96_12105 [Moraxella osloensis]|uniref:Uncharacterized protein n=1 Tax=Faucicola osloensis TaxID=34062 RepID=A0A2I1RF89_FAUOS|nr:hypothetical protein [Moraxella osloensis]PKZ67746.1 hypothetical protein CYJ96_12105 [Moraxella osloensis]
MAPTYLAGGNYPNAWQFAVEAVYRLKICELVDFDFDVLTKSEKFPDTTYHGLDDFCYHLSITEPNDWGCLIWIDAQMYLTNKGRALTELYLQDFDNYNEQINVYFIEKLEEIFSDYNVPWDEDRPIFPIKGTAQN